MKKRIISMLLVLCMVFSMLPISAYAVEAEEEHVHSADCDHVHDDSGSNPTTDGSSGASNPTGADADEANADGSSGTQSPTAAEIEQALTDGSMWASTPTVEVPTA